MNLLKNLLLSLLLTTAFLSPGCKSPEQAALVAVTTVNVSVDSSVGAFNDYRSTHPVPPATVAKVRSLALKYKAANTTLGDAVVAYKTLSTPGSKAKVDTAQAQLATIGSDLITLIRTIDPTLIKAK